MKKITLLFAFLLTTLFVNAQTVTITSINGTDADTYISANSPFAGNTVLTVVLTYQNATGDLTLRLLDGWSPIANTAETKTTIKGDPADNTLTFTLTIPEVSPAITTARIQAFGSGSQTKIIGIQESDVEVSANVTITSINNSTPTEYHTSTSGELTEGETLTIGVDFTALKKDPTRDNLDVRVRFIKNDYTEIPEGVIGTTIVTNSDSEQSTTVSVTVPNISENLTGVRMQVLGYGFSAGSDITIYSYVTELFNIDATTLSTNKLTLEGVSVNGNVISLGSQHKSDNYTIYNILGKSVKTGTIDSQINISELSSGVYFLITDKGSLKFVK